MCPSATRRSAGGGARPRPSPACVHRRRPMPRSSTWCRSTYANPIRAGYLRPPSWRDTPRTSPTIGSGDPIFPRDAADDNYNAFDLFPPRLTGEVGDGDFYDAAGSLMLPVERMRRFVTPMDINGTGRVHQFNPCGRHPSAAAADTSAASSSPAISGRPDPGRHRHQLRRRHRDDPADRPPTHRGHDRGTIYFSEQSPSPPPRRLRFNPAGITVADVTRIRCTA